MSKTTFTNKTNKNNEQSNMSSKALLFKMVMSNIRPVSRYTGSIEVPLSL